MKIPFLQIEPTTRCNFACKFCCGRHLPQADLDFDRYGRLLDQVEGLEQVELQGEGEPLLNPRFFDMIAAARRRFPGVGFSTITNGSLFTPGNIAGFLEHGVERIYVSMESAREERFRGIRGGSLERVRVGLRALIEARRARGAVEPKVGIAVTVLRSTLDDVFDTILPFYREAGLDGGFSIQPLQAMPAYARHYDDAMRAELVGTEEYSRFTERLRASPEAPLLMGRQPRAPGFFGRLFEAARGRPACPWLGKGLYVTAGGAFTACCFIKDADRSGLGRIGDDLRTVLTRRRALAERLESGHVPPECSGCKQAHRIAVAWATGRGAGR
jgi:MoaA/NifB/PqqE/SkfB family radical SAM enzyme